MHQICKNCPLGRCGFDGIKVYAAIQACQFIPIGKGIRYLQTLSKAEQNEIVSDGRLPGKGDMSLLESRWKYRTIITGKNEKAEDTPETIARQAVFGSDSRRLNMN
jgi:hypothetical protein